MKRLFAVFLTFGVLLSLSGCTSKSGLRYEECVFNREAYYENWVVESLDGVSPKVKEVSPEKLVVELSNTLDHEVRFTGWSRAFAYKDGVWYTVLPEEDIATPSVESEISSEDEAARTIYPGESKEFTYDFPASYQGEILPAGDYRIRMILKYPSPQANDPSGLRNGEVWIDFVVD